MTLDANKPEDSISVSELSSYIREDRVEINSIIAGSNISDIYAGDLEISAGATSLTIGTELHDIGIEIIFVSAEAAVIIDEILGGTEGQIKIFIFQDNQISLTDGVRSGGKIYLNHLPALSNFTPQRDDVIAVINKNGDGLVDNGYWKELYRTISVK